MKVRGETGLPVQAAVGGPGIGAALRQILAAHQHGPHPGMAGDMMVHVLAGIGFVVHQEALVAEAEVLDEDCVAGQVLVALVGDLDAPEPDVRLRAQPERHLMPDAAALSFPHDAVRPRADPQPRIGADDRAHRGPGAPDPQKESRHAVANRGGHRLVDHHPARAVDTLHRKDGAAWKQGDRQPGRVSDIRHVKIASAWRNQGFH